MAETLNVDCKTGTFHLSLTLYLSCLSPFFPVRDAAARLPNGEGTRADIVTLLRDSALISATVTDNQVTGVVSGALDRLHYERDPCVKYDPNRKLWIYLHRHREEQDFGEWGQNSEGGVRFIGL